MSHPVFIKPRDGEEVLRVASEFYGAASKDIFLDICDSIQRANYQLNPPIAPISKVKFLFIRGESDGDVAAQADTHEMAIHYIFRDNQTIKDREEIDDITFHEVSHLIRHQYRRIGHRALPRDIFGHAVDEGISFITGEEYTGIDHDWLEVDEELYASTEKLLSGKRVPVDRELMRAFLYGDEDHPLGGFAVGYLIAKMISIGFDISARDMMPLSEDRLFSMARQVI